MQTPFSDRLEAQPPLFQLWDFFLLTTAICGNILLLLLLYEKKITWTFCMPCISSPKIVTRHFSSSFHFQWDRKFNLFVMKFNWTPHLSWDPMSFLNTFPGFSLHFPCCNLAFIKCKQPAIGVGSAKLHCGAHDSSPVCNYYSRMNPKWIQNAKDPEKWKGLSYPEWTLEGLPARIHIKSLATYL